MEAWAIGGLGLVQGHGHGRRHLALDHVVGEDRHELVLVLRLQQRLDRALRQRGEGLVGRGEHGQRAFGLQRLDQAGGLHRGHERVEAAGLDRGVDDVGVSVLLTGAALAAVGVGGDEGRGDEADDRDRAEQGHGTTEHVSSSGVLVILARRRPCGRRARRRTGRGRAPVAAPT